MKRKRERIRKRQTKLEDESNKRMCSETTNKEVTKGVEERGRRGRGGSTQTEEEDTAWRLTVHT